MKKVLLVIGIVLLVIVAALGGLFIYVSNDLKEFQKMIAAYQLTDITPDMIPDGVYRGKVESLLVAVDLEVTVKDKKFTDIKVLTLRSGPGYGATNMPARLLKAQSIMKADAVTGASGTSKAYRVAMHKALIGAVVATPESAVALTNK